MEDEDIYRGRFEHLPDRQLKSIRIFLSSTFSDTTEERNGLIEFVYPKLRDYCFNQYHIQFQYSDMRWGIQPTALTSHLTVDMCLDELDTCSRLSLATNCVILLSHRYGSRFIPASIPFHLFHLLADTLSSNPDEKEFLSQMYQLDENYLAKKYILRNILDEHQWIAQEKKLHYLLRKAARQCYEQGIISEDERKEFFISVTAKEIHRALKNNHQSSRRIVCFFREILDINQLDGKYRESDDDLESQELLEEIKQLLHQSIDPSDIYTYQVQWKNDQQRTKYFSQFFDDFYQAIQSQIDYHMQSQANQKKSLLYNQIFEHAIQCKQLTERYFPRNDILQQIKEYILSTNHNPCVLIGESGTGKSSIMAKIVSEIPHWLNPVSVIIRFLGATPSSSDIRRPLISIIEQISSIYHWEKPTSFTVIKDDLEKILMKIPKNEHLILLLDSLDQLDINDVKNLSRWLPTRFPSSNIKCIYSTISEIEIDRETIHIRQQLQNIYPNGLLEIHIPTFDEYLAKQVLSSWLDRDHRCLTSIQHQWLEPKFTVRHWLTPLFLSLLYDQTLTWHSYDQTPEPAFLAIKRTSDAIGYLYEQLGKKHGSILFRHSMKYLQLSGGLSELEIEDLLSLDDQVLQSVFVHYLPPMNLFRLPSTLWIRIRNDMQKYLIEKDIDQIPCIYFYHRSFQYYQPLNVKQMIVENEEKVKMEEIRLNYFSNRYKETFDMSYSPKLMKKYHLDKEIISVNRCLTPQKSWKTKKNNSINLRRLHQLCININRYDFAHSSTIFNYEFLMTYLTCGEYRLSDLLYQFSIGAHDPNGELRYLLKEFERSAEIIDEYPRNFPFEIIYRLLPFEDQLPNRLGQLLDECLKHCPLQLKTNNERMQSLAKYSLSNILDFTLDSHRLFLLTDDENIHVFYYHYYRILYTKPLEIKSKNERFVSFQCRYPYICCLSSNKTMRLINWDKREISMDIPCKQLIGFVNDHLVLIRSLQKNQLEIWDCADKQLKSQYHSPDQPLIDRCSLHRSIITVHFQESNNISLLSINQHFQIEPIRIITKDIDQYPHCILLDTSMEFHYSNEHSQALFIEDHSKHILEFSSPPKSVIFLRQSSSIVWFTSTSLMLFHPVIKEKFFQPFSIQSSVDYDLIHDHYSSLEFENQTNFLACSNRLKQIIDIYEWKYESEQHRHIHRQLTHIQFDIPIDRFVFTANWFDGITIYLSDGANLRKYNATMISYLLASKSQFPSPAIGRMSIESSSDEYFTLITDDNSVKVYAFNEDDTLHVRLSLRSIRACYLTKRSPHVLVIHEKNDWSIYSLMTSKLLYTNAQLNDEDLRIHALDSSFICISSNEVFLLDTQSLQLKCLTQFSEEFRLSTVTGNNRWLYLLLSNGENLLEVNVEDLKITKFSLTGFHSKKIQRLESSLNRLIFQTDDEQIHLWRRETQQILSLEKASNFLVKDNRLVLVSDEDSCLILYDLQEKLRGIIPLDEDIGHCEALQLTDEHLFTISHDGLLRMYLISNGKQLTKLFIHANLCTSIRIVQERVLLQVDEQICVLKILDRKYRSKPISKDQSPLFEQSMWMQCHHNRCTWSDI